MGSILASMNWQKEGIDMGTFEMSQSAWVKYCADMKELRAENERMKGESEVQRGLFNAAMDRAEKAEAENERLVMFYKTATRIGKFQAFVGEIDLRDKDIKRLTVERDGYKREMLKLSDLLTQVSAERDGAERYALTAALRTLPDGSHNVSDVKAIRVLAAENDRYKAALEKIGNGSAWLDDAAIHIIVSAALAESEKNHV